MTISINDQHELQKYLYRLYGEESTNWKINDQVFDVVFFMVRESRKCSDLMDLIPRPMPVGANPSTWLTSEVRSAIIRAISDEKQLYHTCVVGVKASWKTAIYQALNGMWSEEYYPK